MIKKLKTFLAAVAVVFMLVSEAQAYTFTTLDVPGAIHTYARGINDSGKVVGWYEDSSGNPHGFIYDGSTYTPLGYPGAYDGAYTYGYDINDSGKVVGYYIDSSWNQHGFIYDGSKYTPLGLNTMAYGINDSGDVVGEYRDDSGIHGFIYDGSEYTTLDYPDPDVSYTYAYGINDSGAVAGQYYAGGWHGFIYDRSMDTYTPLDVPGAAGTFVCGINDSGDVAGYYVGGTGWHSFVYDGSTDTYTPLDYLDFPYTNAYGINDSGDVVGTYSDSGYNRGFIATAVLDVTIDIKPQACPNPLNIKSKGVFPVAILGTSDFDVNTIDVNSITLNGVAPIRSAYEDVAALTLTDLDPCDCLAPSGDGTEDLVLKFEKQAIIAEIIATHGPVENGDEIPLTLTGELLDGTPIEGSDCVVIKGKK